MIKEQPTGKFYWYPVDSLFGGFTEDIGKSCIQDTYPSNHFGVNFCLELCHGSSIFYTGRLISSWIWSAPVELFDCADSPYSWEDKTKGTLLLIEQVISNETEFKGLIEVCWLVFLDRSLWSS